MRDIGGFKFHFWIPWQQQQKQKNSQFNYVEMSLILDKSNAVVQ